MATTVKTFQFTSNAEGFTFTSDSGKSTGAWVSSGGNNDAGCIEVSTDGRNSTDTAHWDGTFTFEDLGVPSGATVTGITSASMYTQCIVFNVVDSAAIGPATLTDGSTPVTLASSRTITATDGSYVQQTGVDNTSLNWASTQSVTITLASTMDLANDAAAEVHFYMDDLSFTITYTEGSGTSILDFERGTPGVMRGVGRGT